MEWTSQVVTKEGGAWLSISPSSGTVGPPPAPLEDGPAQMQTYVSVSPVGLKPGVYTGSITITASRLYQGIVYPATNSPQTVTVTYTVTNADLPSVRVSTNSLALSGVAGIGAPSVSSVSVTNGGPGTLNWSAALQNAANTPWLSIATAARVNGGDIGIAANPGSLSPGVYTGVVAVTSPDSPSQLITVTYTVRPPKPATLDVPQTPLSFTAVTGTNPAQQSVAISNSGELALNWKASSSTFNGGQWLSLAPAQGTNNGNVVISVNAGALSPGIYAGRITIASDAGLQAVLQANLTVTRTVPTLASGGFYNAASLAPDGVVAGSLASVFGNHLGPEQGAASSIDPLTGRLPVSLAGTRVTIDGVAAPLFYVSAKQINLQIPYEAAGKNSVTARIEADGYDPAEFTINLSPASIGAFTIDGKRAAALNQDGAINSSESPAPAGSVVQFFGTGQGSLDRPVPNGLPVPAQAPLPAPVSPITVQIGGMPAKVLFAGLAPGSIGMLQLNVEIPAGIAPSDLTPVQIQTGSAKSNVVYISTRPAQE